MFQFLSPSVVKCVVSKKLEDQEIGVRLPLLHKFKKLLQTCIDKQWHHQDNLKRMKKLILRKKAEEIDFPEDHSEDYPERRILIISDFLTSENEIISKWWCLICFQNIGQSDFLTCCCYRWCSLMFLPWPSLNRGTWLSIAKELEWRALSWWEFSFSCMMT